MRITQLTLPALFALACASCSNAEHPAGTSSATGTHYTEEQAAVADSVAPSSAYASGRMLIKTVAYKCMVNDVYRATDAVEHIAQSLGGMVTDSKMEQQDVRLQEVAVSRDSVRRTKAFIPVARLTLKVPVAQSDSLLRVIQALSSSAEIPFRHIYYDDVTMDMHSNTMRNEIYGQNDHSNTALARARKSEEVIAVDQYKNEGSEQSIDRKLANMALADEVNYATINVDFEQPEQIVFTTVANTASLARATFGQRLNTALAGSLDLLQQMILLLLHIWPLLAFVASVVLIVRLCRRRPANILTGR